MSSKYEKLTPKMRKLIETMANPANNDLNVQEICKLTGISTPTYYEYFHKPVFIKAYDQLTQDLLKHAVIPMVKAAVREGRKGSYQDRKMVLEMTGTYQSKSALDVNVRGFEDLLGGLADSDSSEED